jgi:hypothetical protein
MRQFNLGAQTEWQLPLRYNIAPTQDIAVIGETDSGRALEILRWGLIPSWSKDPKSGPKLIMPRSKTAEKPTFRSAMPHRRCNACSTAAKSLPELIIASGRHAAANDLLRVATLPSFRRHPPVVLVR